MDVKRKFLILAILILACCALFGCKSQDKGEVVPHDSSVNAGKPPPGSGPNGGKPLMQPPPP